MATPAPLVFRWGIISTGWIAGCFVRDALVDPKTRGVTDVIHKVVAVGSRTADKAKEFIEREVRPLDAETPVKAFGSYAEVYADPDVDAIYIGTPHTSHYENARDALLAGKAVLCEKPVTSNVAELHDLLRIAKEKKLFFMEALWTRFHPLSAEVKKINESGVLGEPTVVHADLSGDFNIANIPKTHRILDPELGGGALLDLGPYPLVWAIMTLYEHPANKGARPTSISGTMLKTPITGVDSSTSFTLNFSEHLHAQAILSCSITLPGLDPGVTIRYPKGNILVHPPIYSPRSFTVQYLDKDGKVEKEEKKEFEYNGRGWHFQADEVARCVRDGKLESDKWTHDKSILEMEIFDEVRRQGKYVFPAGVEKIPTPVAN